MMYSFITEKDLDVAMKEYFRGQITEQEDKKHIERIAEGSAFSLIKAKLNNRYDLALLFPATPDWDNTTPFTQGQYCYKNGVIYRALQDSTNQQPDAANSAYWKEKDPRDQLLVVYCAVITVYQMLQSTNPRVISQRLENEYVRILEWLDDVKEGNESPAWPLVENGSSTIQWGSEPKIDHYY